ncbi:hypothetical protein LMG27174_06798 [Paraburkholderia rhynchosiae]|uniref:Uncharacterized protein n=1 Tax=Paraburkholderia rhynchosiae TaxID=487049 RepID=A0A6J5CNS3_9BURK|nr:hypothetical protein LMG27174_06798 [Paraburkholderia rhynchosiae]
MLAWAAKILEGGPLACLHAIADAQGKGTAPSPYRRVGESQIRKVSG